MQGNIFDIQRFCVHDGPGIRTTVFFKGCPLRCLWCHNPESQKASPSIAYYRAKCIGCGACAAVCERNGHVLTEKEEGVLHLLKRDGCITCGSCAAACPTGAIEALGRRVSADEILSEVLRDKLFYKNSGGGLTVSGGEPLMQWQFLTELLSKAKGEGLNTCIETCGYAPKDVIKAVAPYVDTFLFDIKETDDERHKALTGVLFTPIKENLLLLDSLGAKIVLRCPIIPEKNLRDEHLEGIAKIAAGLKGLEAVEVMAYHTLGSSKYEALDMPDAMVGTAAMDDEEKKRCEDRIKELIDQKR